MKLVLASNNAKKLKELAALFSPLPIELVTQGSLGVSEAEEPHVTFIENALAKARHAAQATGLPAIADDSGLCVDALGGQPGVQSAVYARYSAPEGDREAHRRAQDQANNQLLLQNLAGHTAPGARSAALSAPWWQLRAADDPEPLIAFGRWPGEILAQRAGAGGFGYDPLMYIPALGATAAELAPEVKNAHSHRALAAAQMLRLLREQWQVR